MDGVCVFRVGTGSLQYSNSSAVRGYVRHRTIKILGAPGMVESVAVADGFSPGMAPSDLRYARILRALRPSSYRSAIGAWLLLRNVI
jgi:hypothetical protein